MKYRICAALLAASAVFGLSACATDDYGYGYGGVDVGYGAGYYGSPYYGWYDDFYYPGTGYYVYDRYGSRRAWNDSQRRYWEGRRNHRGSGRENWSGYRGYRGNQGDSQAWQQRRDAWRAQRQQEGTSVNREAWQQRREAYRAQRQQEGASTPQQGRGNWHGRGAGRQRPRD